MCNLNLSLIELIVELGLVLTIISNMTYILLCIRHTYYVHISQNHLYKLLLIPCFLFQLFVSIRLYIESKQIKYLFQRATLFSNIWKSMCAFKIKSVFELTFFIISICLKGRLQRKQFKHFWKIDIWNVKLNFLEQLLTL